MNLLMQIFTSLMILGLAACNPSREESTSPANSELSGNGNGIGFDGGSAVITVLPDGIYEVPFQKSADNCSEQTTLVVSDGETYFQNCEDELEEEIGTNFIFIRRGSNHVYPYLALSLRNGYFYIPEESTENQEAICFGQDLFDSNRFSHIFEILSGTEEKPFLNDLHRNLKTINFEALSMNGQRVVSPFLNYQVLDIELHPIENNRGEVLFEYEKKSEFVLHYTVSSNTPIGGNEEVEILGRMKLTNPAGVNITSQPRCFLGVNYMMGVTSEEEGVSNVKSFFKP